MALDSVRANKFRSVLTVLGIVVGVTTAIVVASILTGMRQSIVAIVEDYGTNNIYAFHLSTGFDGGDRDERSRKPLTVEDAEAIMAGSPAVEDIALVAPGIGNFGAESFDDNIVYEGKNYRRAQTDGVSPNYADISNLTLLEGRFISEADNQNRRNVLVIGVNAAEALFPDQTYGNVGKHVRMNGAIWEIIGVIAKRKAALFGENEEDSKVLLPYRTARKVAPQRAYLLQVIQAKKGRVQEALEDAEGILRQRRGVKYGDPNDFDIKSAGDFVKQFDSVTAMVGLIAIAISSLGLLVGGIGVMNIMLVSVTERTREIGIRKAIGARNSDIMSQFLIEAGTLTGFGGLLGLAVGWILTTIVGLFFPSYVPYWAPPAGFFASVGIGLLFGLWPAWKAAKLDPIEALRYE